jgi:hypothetical protein
MKTLNSVIVLGSLLFSGLVFAQSGRISSGGSQYIPKNNQIALGFNLTCQNDSGALKTLRVAEDGSKVELYDFNSFCIFSGPQDSTNLEYADSKVFMGSCDTNRFGRFAIVVSNKLLPGKLRPTSSGSIFIGETYRCSQNSQNFR